MSNDKKKRKLIIIIAIVLVLINLIVFGILFLDLSQYIWPEKNETPVIKDNGFELSKDGTVTIDGITYKQKTDGNFIVISCDKFISMADIRDKINEYDIGNVNEIGERAFENCTEITEILIPATITTINDYAFSNCNKLSTITIPYSVQFIGDSCFYDCKNLTSIKVAVANEYYTSYNGILYDIDGKTLYVYPFNKTDGSYKLSDDLQSIENNAFRGFEKLKSVMLPENLINVGDGAFENCINLDSVLIPESVTSIGNNAFSNCSENLVIYGIAGSYAETYANENNITFKPSNERPNTATDNTENNEGQTDNEVDDTNNTDNQEENNTANTPNNNITDIVDITNPN